MAYRFPDVEAALMEVLTATQPGVRTVLWLTDTEGTVHHVYSSGGNIVGPFRTDRVTVDTYAPSRDLARTAAEDAQAALTERHHDTSEGLLDTVEVEVAPHSMPYQSDTVSLWQAVYRVDTRPLPSE